MTSPEKDEEMQQAAEETQPVAASKPGRSAPVLPWMRVPLTIHPGDGTLLEDVGGLDPRLLPSLHSAGIEVLFPVQTVVWEATAGGASALHDICLAAPTGSGKTLAYTLPLLHALARRPPPPTHPALQALIVLPTRDLAQQVAAVLQPLCQALSLQCCLACGSAGLGAEAESLPGARVVVATPGRLVAHLQGTLGFCLASLRFLVVDEADRLLRQSYQNWLPRVLEATALARSRVVKFVVSATLTKDPSKMDRLGLHCPRYVAMAAEGDHRYKLPPGLQEEKLVVPAEQKPYALAALLASLRPARTVVFASSVDATHRLSLMLRSPALREAVGEAVEYSAALPPEARRAALAAFKEGRASVLMSSDAMTRGMDVEGVEVVVNYDAPVYAKTYVHRAGRTARAGKNGRVVTVLRKEDVRHFKAMLRKADNAYVKDARLEKEQIDAVRGAVRVGLEEMAAALEAEGGGGGGGGIGVAAAVAPELHPALKKSEKELQQAGTRSNVNAKPGKRRKLTGLPAITLF